MPPTVPVLGVCSWSLRTLTPSDTASALAACSLNRVQLALEPIRTGAWALADTRAAFAQAGITIDSGMMSMRGEDYSTLESIHATGGLRPDTMWPANRAAAEENAEIAEQLGITLVTFHAGFLPPNASDPLRRVMSERLRETASIFARRNIRIALETGQESAATLLACLRELADLRIGVNFDPANIILYASGDPIAALRDLLPHVAQVHIKDARRTSVPGTWGEEVRAGDGEVDWPAFFTLLKSAPQAPALMIEREAGDARIEDIRHAAHFVRGAIGIR